ncbi:MAG TPA: peptide chain release factor N(5)-glutamine methyltransferase [Phycisphaerae bacterium]|jgi:release factor glutamine methyltransferase
MTQPVATPSAEWTIGRLLAWTREHLGKAGVEEPRLAAEVLLAHALGRRRIDLYTRFEAVPEPQQLGKYRELVKLAAQHTPIAYLVGRREFYSLDFEVTPDVLIPRPETELLVERVIQHAGARGEGEAPAEPSFPQRILDLGTGSGCIVLAILKHLPSALAVASDRSAAALAVARRNAERLGLADRVRFVEADGLNLPAAAGPERGFDVLVSNPPYIPAGEWAHLPRSVREHEPRAALVGGADGLDFYRLIARDAPARLAPHAAIFVEIGAEQAEAVASIFQHAGQFESAGAWRDPGHSRPRAGCVPDDRVTGHVRVMGFRTPPARAG